MGQILAFVRPQINEKADGVFAAINIAARRMGYSENLAFRAARDAKDRALKGKDSPARVVSDASAALRKEAPEKRA